MGTQRNSRRRTAVAIRRAVLAGTLVTAFGLVSVQPMAHAVSPVQITMTPSLFPAYSPTVTDYVVRCTGSPVQVSVNASTGYTVSVAGQAPNTGSFVAPVPLSTGQEFTLQVFNPDNTSTTGFVRCLPSDFPSTTPVAPDAGTSPQSQFYVVTPFANNGGAYVALFDTNGVPVWWINAAATSGGNAIFGTFLPNGHVGWTKIDNTAAFEVTLDGSVVHTIAGANGTTDIHELVLLPNGDYLVGVGFTRNNVDLSVWGGSFSTLTSVPIFDFLLQEISPSGATVFSWDAFDHIPVSETDPNWRGQQTPLGAYDVYHFNSLEAQGNSYIASFRHLDAVYKINKSGGIVWKLGGINRANSLTINGDPVFPGSGFGGQHDARALPDGTVSLLDDGSLRSRPPRAVRYSINTPAKTATLVETVVDSLSPSELCCGSARKLPGGNWVLDFGVPNHTVTELTATGQRAWGLTLNGLFGYRTIPVMPGQVSIGALRAGMDTQFVRPGISGSPPSPVNAGDPYSFTFTLHGSPTPTTSVTGGSLPPGITLSPNGVLSGTPTQAGSYGAGVTATNGAGPNASVLFPINVLTTAVLTPNNGPKGTAFGLHATGFQASESVTVKYQATSTSSLVVCTGTASVTGVFDCNGTIPTGPAAGVKGAHVVQAKGQTSGIKAKATFTVT